MSILDRALDASTLIPTGTRYGLERALTPIAALTVKVNECSDDRGPLRYT